MCVMSEQRVPDPKIHAQNLAALAEAKGAHVWVMVAAWRVIEPAATRDLSASITLDVENLLTLEGPGCYVCEQVWTPEVGMSRCPGDPAYLDGPAGGR